MNATYTIGKIVPKAEHIAGRIPTSIYYDFDEFSDTKSAFSYTVPTEAQFKEQMRKLNIRKSDLIVVYDKIGVISAPRAFWLMKTFGAPNVRILNGVFNKWQAEQRQIESGDVDTAWRKKLIGESSTDPEEWNYSLDSSRVKKYEDIVKIS